MRIIVCGSRGWSDRALIADRLADLPGDATVVIGYDPEHDRPKGADRIAYQEAQKLGLALEAHPAEWERHPGRSAGFVRNEEMAEFGADLCLAFWDGSSAGTMDMMERCARRGIPVDVVHRDFPNRPRRQPTS